jgi:uncharacterized iron-regulated membrane protein
MPDGAASARPSRLYPLFWRWHFLAALIVIPFVLWQSTTGTLYLWSEWWIDVRYPELRFVTASNASVLPSLQIEAALASIGASSDSRAVSHDHGAAAHHASASPPHLASSAVQQIALSDDPRRSTIVIMEGENGLPYPVFVDPHTGHVLGSLTGGQWLPGVTRALHAGWPLGATGNRLLELGNCWAIVMIATGLYLWWPRGRTLLQALRLRLDAGPRLLLRDLHSTVAVMFAAVLCFFLVSALPWTSFWGGEILTRIQHVLGQESPAGFSTGGASAEQMIAAGTSIDAVAKAARERGVTGTLAIQLSPWQGAPLFLTNRTSSLRDDRIVTANAVTGEIRGDFGHHDLPLIPRLVAVGVHVHQGDFGLVNFWLNTALAVALVWLSATGAAHWWIRRPPGQLGMPQAREIPWTRTMVVIVVTMSAFLPIFGLSVLLVFAVSKFVGLVYGKRPHSPKPRR